MPNKFTARIAPIILLALLIGSVGVYTYKSIKGQKSVTKETPKKALQPSPSPIDKMIKFKPNPTLIKQKDVKDLIAQARANLAEKLNIKQSKITTKEVESVIWNDTSLGCPESGMFYAQVLTPGYKIILEANRKTFKYHTSLRNVKLCP